MCTVTYLPQKDASSIVTANRDESPVRNSDGLVPHFNEDDQRFFIAKEPLHGGTNLAIGENHTTVLLNGAFLPHQRRMNYRKSRGIVVLDSLNFTSLSDFQEDHFDGIEPFTLLRFGEAVEELRWDEHKIHFRVYDSTKPLILASAKLYSPEVRMKREKWFADLFNTQRPDPEQLWDFHMSGGDGDPENDMVMNRFNMVCTVSISQICSLPNRKVVKHFDLVKNKTQELILER